MNPFARPLERFPGSTTARRAVDNRPVRRIVRPYEVRCLGCGAPAWGRHYRNAARWALDHSAECGAAVEMPDQHVLFIAGYRDRRCTP